MGKTVDVAGALDVGRRAQELIIEHSARLAPRLGATTATDLARYIVALDGSQAGIPGARHEAKGATVSERELAEQLAEAVRSLRDLFKSKNLSAAQLKSLGVGLQMNPEVTKTVIAAASAIVSHASAAGDLASLGLKPRDVQALERLMAQLAAADTSQRGKQKTSQSATTVRDAAILGAFRIAYQVGSAGAVEFSPLGSDPEAREQPDPELVKLFRKLADDSVVPSDRARNKKKPPADPPA